MSPPVDEGPSSSSSSLTIATRRTMGSSIAVHQGSVLRARHRPSFRHRLRADSQACLGRVQGAAATCLPRRLHEATLDPQMVDPSTCSDRRGSATAVAVVVAVVAAAGYFFRPMKRVPWLLRESRSCRIHYRGPPHPLHHRCCCCLPKRLARQTQRWEGTPPNEPSNRAILRQRCGLKGSWGSAQRPCPPYPWSRKRQGAQGPSAGNRLWCHGAHRRRLYRRGYGEKGRDTMTTEQRSPRLSPAVRMRLTSTLALTLTVASAGRVTTPG